MKAFLSLLLVAAAAHASELTELEDLGEADARIFFVNFTSSLVQVNATILAYGLLFLAILGAAAVALYYLYLESQNSGGYGYGYSGGNSGYHYQYARSNDDGFDFTGTASIITWITRLQDLYEKFDTNNIECHKRLICEVMKDPSYYGSVAQKAKVGFQYAKYLEVLSMPDEMRELLDEYLDANARSDAQKSCKDFFDCDYSIKDSFQKAISGNGL